MKDANYNFRVLRILRILLVTILLGVIPAVILVLSYAPRYVSYVLAAGAALLLATRIGFHVWPCPRCGKPFCRISAWGGQNMFTRQCVHCGLHDREVEEEVKLDLSGKSE